MKFVGEEIRKLLGTIECPRCHQKGAEFIVMDEGPHFGKANCKACGSWVDWIAWPKTEEAEKRDRKRSRRYVTRLGTERCEICLRHASQLPGTQKLEVQHVIEKAAGGEDDPENFRIYCTACHSWVNWVRTYFGHYHLGDAVDEEES